MPMFADGQTWCIFIGQQESFVGILWKDVSLILPELYHIFSIFSNKKRNAKKDKVAPDHTAKNDYIFTVAINITTWHDNEQNKAAQQIIQTTSQLSIQWLKIDCSHTIICIIIIITSIRYSPLLFAAAYADTVRFCIIYRFFSCLFTLCCGSHIANMKMSVSEYPEAAICGNEY